MKADIHFLLESHLYDTDVLIHLGFPQEAIDFYLEKGILQSRKSKLEFDFVGFLYVKDKEFFVCPKYRKTVYEKSMIPVFKNLFKKFKTETVQSENLRHSETLSRLIVTDFLKSGAFKEEQQYADNDWDSVCWDDLVSNPENFLNGRLIVSEPQTTTKSFGSNSNTLRMQKQFISFVLSKSPLLTSELQLSGNLSEPCKYTEKEMIQFFHKELNRTRLFREKRMMKFYLDFLTTKESEFEFYGTKYFHTIWEFVCKQVFNDQSEKYTKSFPKPIYLVNGKESRLKGHIPDVISLPDDSSCFVLDAKYYNLDKAMPQTEDVAKQLFYEKLCKKIFPTRTLSNAFLFLNEQSEDILNVGNVIYDVFDEKEITLLSLKDTFIFSLFCKNEKLNPKMLPM